MPSPPASSRINVPLMRSPSPVRGHDASYSRKRDDRVPLPADELKRQRAAPMTKLPDFIRPLEKADLTGGRLRIWIESFEAMLRFHRVDEDSWAQLLSMAVKSERAAYDWIYAEIRNGRSSYSALRASLLRAFEGSASSMDAMERLLLCSMMPGEDVPRYATRYRTLMSQAGKIEHEWSDASFFFVRGLPADLRSRLASSEAIAGPAETLQAAIDRAQLLERASRVEPSHRSSPSVKHHCKFHPDASHDTNACRVFKNWLRRNPAADVSSAIEYIGKHGSLPPEQRSDTPKPLSSPASSSAAASSVRTCYQCGMPGHLKFNCPLNNRSHAMPRYGQPSSSSASLSSSSTSSSSSSSSSTSSPFAPRVVARRVIVHRCPDPYCVDPAHEYDEDEIKNPSTYIKKLSSFSSTSSTVDVNDEVRENAPIMISLKVDGHECEAEIDCGASHTILSVDWCEKNGIAYEAAAGSAQLVAGGKAQLKGRIASIEISDGHRSVKHPVVVMSMGSDEPHCLLGRDLMPKLGYFLGRLPFRVADREPDGIDLRATVPDENLKTRTCTAHPQQSMLMAAIANELERNSKVTGFCPLPQAVVCFQLPVGRVPYIPQYRVPQANRDAMNQAVQKWIDRGRVIPATSNCSNFPLTGAQKRNPVTGLKSEVRTCIDVRRLNELLKEMTGPSPNNLPKIDDILEMISGANVISVMDVSDAFPSLPVEEKTQEYLQFTWEGKRWQFCGAPFGVHMLTAHFQNVMMTLFRDERSFVMFFVDDIIIVSQTMDAHMMQVKHVLKKLTQNNFKVNPDKCQFGYLDVYLLGHKATVKGIELDRRKLIGIHDWPIPQASTIEHYLGLFNYFRKFIPTYAELACPLEKVRKSFSWGPEQERSWSLMKKALIAAPILHHPDWTKTFYLGLDASKNAVSAVLFQMRKKEDEIPKDVKFLELSDPTREINIVSFLSRATTGAEVNYSPNKLETLALVFGLQRYRNYLLGREFVVITDHRALVWLFTKSKVNQTIGSWLDVILDFAFEVIHCPGIRNLLPDVLTRIYSSNSGGDDEAAPRFVKPRKEIEPMFVPSPVVVHRVTVAKSAAALPFDLKELDKIKWQAAAPLSPLMTSEEGGNRRARTPQPLWQTLEKIFGKFFDPCPLDHTEDGLKKDWQTMNFVHCTYYNTEIMLWLRKGIEQALKMKATSIFLLPKWKSQAWYRAMINAAHSYQFEQPIRLEPFRLPPKYKSVLFIMTPTNAQEIEMNLNKECFNLELQDPSLRTVVDNEEQRCEMINRFHAMGHFGTTAIFRAISSAGFRWPNMLKEIRDKIAGCRECQKHQIQKIGFHPLQSVKAEMPMDHVAMDCKHMPTSVEGYNYVLVVIDACTRFVFFRALRTTSGQEVAKKLFKLFSNFGFPKILQSDNGPEFRNSVLESLKNCMTASHRFTTPYHPRGNGIAEAAVKKLKSIMRKMLNGATVDWKRYLASAQYMANLKVASLHHSSPFSLFFARRANELADYRSVENALLSQDQLEGRLKYMTDLVFPSIAGKIDKVQAYWKDQFDSKHNLVNIPDGSLVMTVVERKTGGLQPEYEGPFKVVRRTRGGSYMLLDGDGKLLSRNYSPNQVRLIRAPDVVDLDETYEVEKILDYKLDDDNPGKYLYLVKWKHYSDAHNTWEPEEHFQDTEIISRFMDNMRQVGRLRS